MILIVADGVKLKVFIMRLTSEMSVNIGPIKIVLNSYQESCRN